MVWLILLILLVLIFGLGSLLEAAFWVLVIVAVAVVVLAVVGARALGSGD